MRRLAIPLACLLLATLPAGASAQRGNAPPGNSGIDEYVESIPDAGGNRPTEGIGSVEGASRLSRRSQRALAARGSVGTAAANLAGATAPEKRRLDPSEEGRSEDAASGPASAVRRAVTGSGEGGMGLVLPVILVLTVLAAASIAVARWTTRGEGQEPEQSA